MAFKNLQELNTKLTTITASLAPGIEAINKIVSEELARDPSEQAHCLPHLDHGVTRLVEALMWFDTAKTIVSKQIIEKPVSNILKF